KKGISPIIQSKMDLWTCPLFLSKPTQKPNSPRDTAMAYRIKRSHYAEIYGPTTGDKVRLGDTSLVLAVEKDFTTYGDECKFGGGKVLRDGMGQATGVIQDDALDCVITNALVVDYTGIYKADI